MQWQEKARKLGDRKAYAEHAKTLRGPEPPPRLAYLYRWFLDLDSTRQTGVNGPEGFTYPMIDAWARLMDERPLPHEVSALMALDRAIRFPRNLDEKSV